MPKRCGVLVVLLLALLAHAGAAYGAGASASATGDPPAGSPAGALYELPLERGRAEAAPQGSGGTGAEGDEEAAGEAATGGGGSAGGPGGGGNASEEGSLYRSENNFGSSSRVPGTPQEGGGDSASGSDGSGSETAESLAQGREAAQAGDSGNTSPATNVALLGAIALIALGSWVLMRKTGPLRTER